MLQEIANSMYDGSMDTQVLIKLAKLIRYYILKMTHEAGSGHPTSCFSAVELMTMLYFKYLHYDLDNPDNPANDRVIFSKGHASALFYSLYAAAGKVSEEDLKGYRTFNSTLEGHPTKRFPFTEAATGSLGQGLSVGAGEAWAGVPHVFVLLGDGELAEGSVWEAVNWAMFHKLDNLIAICDINRLGQSEATMWQYDVDRYRRRFEGFGWATIVIDGHNFLEIDAAYQKALVHKGTPVAILTKTIKGKGIPYWEDKEGWHNKMLPKEELEKALAKFGSIDKNMKGVVQKPEMAPRSQKNLAPSSISFSTNHNRSTLEKVNPDKIFSLTAPEYDKPIATKKAFGNALERLGSVYPNLIVLDGDVANSTHTDQFAKAYPDRFLQMYIAEQNMVGVATGLARRGFMPFVTTFACFLSRAHDQIRMAPLSGVTMYFNGAYGGVSMGKDGPSQMGLEDIALFRATAGSTVLYPSDPYQTERLVEAMLKVAGIVYIRTTREPTPVIYTKDDTFPVGGSKVFDVPNAVATVVAAGITVHEALAAQKELAKEKIGIRVIDCYSVKPIDKETLRKAANETKAIIVVEDHYPEGGLGEAVKSAVSDHPHPPVIHLAVSKLPRSGKPDELLHYEGIDRTSIIEAVKKISSRA